MAACQRGGERNAKGKSSSAGYTLTPHCNHEALHRYVACLPTLPLGRISYIEEMRPPKRVRERTSATRLEQELWSTCPTNL